MQSGGWNIKLRRPIELTFPQMGFGNMNRGKKEDIEKAIRTAMKGKLVILHSQGNKNYKIYS